MKTVVLVDADMFVYKIGYAMQTEEYSYELSEEDEITIAKAKFIIPKTNTLKKLKDALSPILGELDEDRIVRITLVESEDLVTVAAKQYIKTLVSKIRKALDNDVEIKYIMTAPNSTLHNFRFKIYDKYKGNRDNKPHHYAFITELLHKELNPLELATGYEADDKLIIEANKLKSLGHLPIICSLDKDLKQWAGHHLNLDSMDLEEVDQNEANINYFLQVLSGDRIDSIPGIYEWSNKNPEIKTSQYKKRAETILTLLNNYDSMRKYIETIYLFWGLTLDNLKTTESLIKLLTEEPT